MRRELVAASLAVLLLSTVLMVPQVSATPPPAITFLKAAQSVDYAGRCSGTVCNIPYVNPVNATLIVMSYLPCDSFPASITSVTDNIANSYSVLKKRQGSDGCSASQYTMSEIWGAVGMDTQSTTSVAIHFSKSPPTLAVVLSSWGNVSAIYDSYLSSGHDSLPRLANGTFTVRAAWFGWPTTTSAQTYNGTEMANLTNSGATAREYALRNAANGLWFSQRTTASVWWSALGVSFIVVSFSDSFSNLFAAGANAFWILLFLSFCGILIFGAWKVRKHL